MQANKEGIDPKYRKALYYSLILVNQLGGERKAEVPKGAEKIDQGTPIQLTLAHRQMKDAYDQPPKSMVRKTPHFPQILQIVDPN